MQTFLVDNDFAVTATVLDRQRLNKQALEAWQIMLTNLRLDPAGNFRQPKGWFNHPAVVMWRGYEVALHSYIDAMVSEWVARGYKSTILDKATATLNVGFEEGLVASADRPEWMVDSGRSEAVFSSHRRALLCKNYEWYSQFEWDEDFGKQPEGYEYVWEGQ
jgi:hypothetical protein